MLDLIKPITDNIAYLERNSASLGDVTFAVLEAYIKFEIVQVTRLDTSLKDKALQIVFKRLMSFQKKNL